MALTTVYVTFSAGENFTEEGSLAAVASGGTGPAYLIETANGVDLVVPVEGAPVQATLASLDGDQGTLARLSNGDYVMASSAGNDILYSVVEPNGDVVASSSLGVGGPVADPQVAALGDGGFVIAFQRDYANEADVRLFFRQADGTSFTKFIANSLADDAAPAVAALDNGNVAVAWHRTVGGETEIWYGLYDSDGTELLAPTMLDSIGAINRDPAVTALEGGGFAIAYEDDGWVGSDTDISLAIFSAEGVKLDTDDISQNDSDDKMPAMTRLSNGMLMIASEDYSLADPNTRLTLCDPDLGPTSWLLEVGGDEEAPQIAALPDGAVVLGLTSATSGQALATSLRPFRVTNSDAEGDVMFGDELWDSMSGGEGKDILYGGGGTDILNGEFGVDKVYGQAGDDILQLVDGHAVAGDHLSGGKGHDTLEALHSLDLRGLTFESIEQLDFVNPRAVVFDAEAFGNGLALNLLVNGTDGGDSDAIAIHMGTDTYLNLRLLQFDGFDAASDELSVLGDDDAERIVGSSMDDQITGNGGNDILDGRGGSDTLIGGLGDDRYHINAKDEAHESMGGSVSGGDDVVFSTVNYQLGDDLERLFFQGAGHRVGYGNGLANALNGNAGNNTLDGLLGKDGMAGGDGADRFQFSTTLSAGNLDRIWDFEVNVDEIRLADDVFAGLNLGALAGSAFRTGTAAADASDRIIYNKDTGALFFDPDGTGGAAQVRFAMVDANLQLSAADFRVIDDALIPVI